MTSKAKNRKFSGPPRSAMNMVKGFLVISFMAVLLTGCSVPNHGKVWLSYTTSDFGCDNLANCPKLTDESRASIYYQTIGAEDANGNPNFNLEQWKQLFGYQDANVIRAVYGNKLDLQFGRDMNCWQPQGTPRVVCYVSNYGPAPFVAGQENIGLWPNLEIGVVDAGEADIHKSFGTVAMVFDPNGIGTGNNKVGIAFYAFGKADADGNQPLIRSVALDGEGPKTVPGMCMACHSGGDHPVFNHQNNFLPFDVQGFYFARGFYDSNGTFHSAPDLDSQQEAFRQLNALVLQTSPTQAIQNLINGWYSGNVNTPGATVPDDTYIPAGWDIDKISRNLYRHVYRPYCRTCHVAQGHNFATGENLSFESFADFDNAADEIGRQLCGFHSMPNMEVPYGAFIPGGIYAPRLPGLWTDGVAQSALRDYFARAAAGGACFLSGSDF